MNMYNPYLNSPYPVSYNNPAQFNTFTPQTYAAPPQMEIQSVSGEESAKAYPIGPNSSVLLLDKDEPLVWFVTTDASGFKTVKPFTITPYTPEAPVSPNEIRERLDALSERIDQLEGRMNDGKPDHGNAGKDKPGNANTKSNGRNGAGGTKPDSGD